MMILIVHTLLRWRNNLNSYAEEDFIENKNNKREGFFFHKKKQNKKIILVDDDQEILVTYRLFLEGYGYHINSFTILLMHLIILKPFQLLMIY